MTLSKVVAEVNDVVINLIEELHEWAGAHEDGDLYPSTERRITAAKAALSKLIKETAAPFEWRERVAIELRRRAEYRRNLPPLPPGATRPDPQVQEEVAAELEVEADSFLRAAGIPRDECDGSQFE